MTYTLFDAFKPYNYITIATLLYLWLDICFIVALTHTYLPSSWSWLQWFKLHYTLIICKWKGHNPRAMEIDYSLTTQIYVCMQMLIMECLLHIPRDRDWSSVRPSYSRTRCKHPPSSIWKDVRQMENLPCASCTLKFTALTPRPCCFSRQKTSMVNRQLNGWQILLQIKGSQ